MADISFQLLNCSSMIEMKLLEFIFLEVSS
jgi:hypothetical protein